MLFYYFLCIKNPVVLVPIGRAANLSIEITGKRHHLYKFRKFNFLTGKLLNLFFNQQCFHNAIIVKQSIS